jgi:hypothetical protein
MRNARGPIAYTDRDGTAWQVQDVARGVRVPVGAVDASTRLYGRMSGRWAFTHTPHPLARPWPADPGVPPLGAPVRARG